MADEEVGVTEELLDCVSAFEVFVERVRAEGVAGCVPMLVADLESLFRKADGSGAELFLLGALVPDLLYGRISELTVFDRWTREYAGRVLYLLLDQLRVRGVRSFYILDNSIEDERFEWVVKIFEDAGFVVLSPALSDVGEAELLGRIEMAQVFRRHILYVERDGRGRHVAAVRGCVKAAGYTVAYRDRPAGERSMELL